MEKVGWSNFGVIGDRLGDRLKNNLSPPGSTMNKGFPKVGDRLIEKIAFFLRRG